MHFMHHHIMDRKGTFFVAFSSFSSPLLASLQSAESPYSHGKELAYCKWSHNLLLRQVSFSDLVP